MQSHKIVFKQNDLTRPVNQTNLISFGGYLVYDNSAVTQNELVNENNVFQYISNPRNLNFINDFNYYLKQNVSQKEFEYLYYKAKKISPIINDFYNKKVRLGVEPDVFLIFQSLFSTKDEYYKETSFDFINNNRIDNNLVKLIDELSAKTTEDYYISVMIEVKEASVLNNNYKKYLKDSVSNGVTYKESFVNLNKKNDPFEYWNNLP